MGLPASGPGRPGWTLPRPGRKSTLSSPETSAPQVEASGSSACRFLFQRKSLPLATRCSWHFARDRCVTPHDGENRATAWTGRGALGSRFACGRRPGAHGGPVPTGTTLPESAGSTRLPVRVSDACRALTRALGPGRRGWPLWARGPLSLTPCDPGPRAPGWTFRRPRGRFAWAAPKVRVPGPPRGHASCHGGGPVWTFGSVTASWGGSGVPCSASAPRPSSAWTSALTKQRHSKTPDASAGFAARGTGGQEGQGLRGVEPGRRGGRTARFAAGGSPGPPGVRTAAREAAGTEGTRRRHHWRRNGSRTCTRSS